MNCPYCNEPMEEGKLLGSRSFGVVWMPKDFVRPYPNLIFSSIPDSDGMCLSSDYTRRDGYSLSAPICRKCKCGVFPIVSPDSYPWWTKF